MQGLYNTETHFGWVWSITEKSPVMSRRVGLYSLRFRCASWQRTSRHGERSTSQCDIWRSWVRFNTGFIVKFDVVKYGRIKTERKIYLRNRVLIRNLAVRGLRVSLWCGWALKSSGMWRCVIRRVVPDVSKDYDGLFLDCYAWRWSHHDLSKCRKPLTQRESHPKKVEHSKNSRSATEDFPQIS
jgi:hypothetical protein